MTAIQRRRLIWSGARTALLTIIVLLLEWSGWLTRTERVLYDTRAVYCQRFAGPPTKQLVHLDIDDTAITQIGRWPWDRDKLADILDEIRLADPKVMAMDLLFSEPASPAHDEHGQLIDQDGRFAEALRRFDRALVPTSLSFKVLPALDSVERELLGLLTSAPELTAEQCVRTLQAGAPKDQNVSGEVSRKFIEMRARAIYERIYAEMEAGVTEFAKVKARMLPQHFVKPAATTEESTAPVVIVSGPLDHLFEEQYARVVRERGVMRFSIPAPPGLPPIIESREATTPLAQMTAAARYGAFVDYVPEGVDGTVRAVPLVAQYRGRLLPHMSIATVCAMLDVDVKDLRLAADSVTIPRPGGKDIVIPVSTRSSTSYGSVGMLMEVPMFGEKDNWETMYDYPRHQNPVQHVSVYAAWQICETRRSIATNESAGDDLLAGAREVAGASVPPDDALRALRWPAKRKLIEDTIASINTVLKSVSANDELPKEIKAKMINDQQPYATHLGEILKQHDPLEQQLTRLRADFHEKLHGKAVFLGGLGTGDVDTHPTSLHHTCPGVVIHGAVFNAIMTGRMWRTAPRYCAYLLIAGVGLLTGLFASSLAPRRAFLATAAIMIGYLLVNGFVLFDYGRWIVPAAGPVLVAALVWSGITLTDFIRETAERGRITRRFSNYVDPSLVNWVIQHPEQARFDGEAREMTMCFTDLVGFTTMIEALGQRAVPLLAEYMNHMIPTIRSHSGFVSRLMGDGIYFFFNAPTPDPDHAVHAVSTMLGMFRLLDDMNLTLPGRDFPLLHMRGGICTGRVIVGDAGSKEFSDYTAIGDSVNTAARLESANKVFGTRILSSARTIELLKGEFLVRPIANLRVAGKVKGVEVFEPLCRVKDATPEQRQLAELSTTMVKAFQSGKFAECIEAGDLIEHEFGKSKFAGIYRDLSTRYLDCAPTDFDGQVVLTEK